MAKFTQREKCSNGTWTSRSIYRCDKYATRGSIYCDKCKAEAMMRVEMVRDDRPKPWPVAWRA